MPLIALSAAAGMPVLTPVDVALFGGGVADIKHVLGAWVQATKEVMFCAAGSVEMAHRGVRDVRDVIIFCCDGADRVSRAATPRVCDSVDRM